jgi:hypothetical protein
VEQHRAAWLARPAAAPLRLRVAVVTHPAEFARRAALRELVFAGVPPAEVALEYRFFLGLHQEDGVNEKVAAEALRHDDVFMLSMLDSRETLGAKRWEALLWVRRRVAVQGGVLTARSRARTLRRAASTGSSRSTRTRSCASPRSRGARRAGTRTSRARTTSRCCGATCSR